jgi:hypothetical protein
MGPAGRGDARRSLVGYALAAGGGATLVLLAFVDGWATTTRHLVGYGTARVVHHLDGLDAPAVAAGLPLALLGLVTAGAALAALAGVARGVRRPATVIAVAAVLALAVLGGFAAATLAGIVPLPTAVTIRPGPVLLVAAGAATVALVGALLAGRPARAWGRRATAVTVLLLVAVACTPAIDTTPSDAPAPSASTPTAARQPDWRSDPEEPYPFTTPLPPNEPTGVDGTYTREPTDRYVGHRAPCRRCPPYPEDRGVSRLVLRNGRFLLHHTRPAYRALGHYEIRGDRIVLFNDVECSDVPGSYRWTLMEGELVLSDPQDPCGFGQRQKDLTALPWRRTGGAASRIECQPPNEEAAVTGHWAVPSGCETGASPTP